MLSDPTCLWQQEHVAMTKHAHHVINLANEDVNLVGMFNKHGGVSRALQHSQLSNLCNARICFVGETSDWESFFLRCFIVCCPLFAVEFTMKNCCLSD